MSTISIKTKPLAPQLRELSAKEIPMIFSLVGLQNEWMSAAQFNDALRAMLPQGYRAVGVFQGDRLIGCSGFWIRQRFWCGRQLDIDNFYVHPEHRRAGIGKQLLAWLEEEAKKEDCQLIVLDTYVTYGHAQRFYMEHGFAMTGFHMTKMPGSTEIGKLPFSAV